MIAWISGRVLERGEDELVVEAGQSGLAYRLSMTSRDLLALEGQEQVQLYVHMQLREDAATLFGFVTREERQLFGKLVQVNGIGSKLALSILGAMTAGALQQAILSQNTAALKKIPGVGAKVAARMLLELEPVMRHFVCEGLGSLPQLSPVALLGTSHSDTRSALSNLGFTESAIAEMIGALDAEGLDLSVEEEIRWVLARMKRV